MAKNSKGGSSGVPANDSGNRKTPGLANKLKSTPTNYKSTAGCGDGAGGGVSPAKDGGNRKAPALANKLQITPTTYNSKS